MSKRGRMLYRGARSKTPLEVKYTTEKGPWGCKCQSLAVKVVGDGCDECNPEHAAELTAFDAVDGDS